MPEGTPPVHRFKLGVGERLHLSDRAPIADDRERAAALCIDLVGNLARLVAEDIGDRS